MLATAGELPDEPGWGYEVKWDGVRVVTYVEGGSVRGLSRNDLDVTQRYPELSGTAVLGRDRAAVLDGEVVALDARGVPSFALLQQRMHANPAQVARLAGQVPVRYVVFDLLHLDGRSLLPAGYAERRAELDGLGLDRGEHVDVPGYEPADGAALMDAARRHGLEGVISKRLAAPYRPGTRSRDWVKTRVARVQEVVVVGWTTGQGRRANLIGSLLLAVHDERGRLVYAGHVGTGFTEAALRDLARRLRPLARPDPPVDDEVPREHARGAHWVQPRLVGEVTYATWTDDGRLRHSSWRGLRPDKRPDDVVREPFR